MVPWSAAEPWRWWQPIHVGASPLSRLRATNLPWIGVDDPSETQRLQAEHAAQVENVSNVQLGGSETLTGADDPRHTLQSNGGLVHLWYTDDGEILCHPHT